MLPENQITPQEDKNTVPEQPVELPSNPIPNPASIYPNVVDHPIVSPPATVGAPIQSKHSSPGVIVLQWLTYAFWGWTIVALSILTASILANFIADADTGSFTPYGIAAVLVLLPIAFICDHFYSKHEPAKKTGPAMAIMVIHAVIFALFGIGSLIAVVFVLVSMVTSTGSNEAKIVSLISSLIIAVFYALAFVRTLNPPRFPKLSKFYRYTMLLVVTIVAILGIVGPVAKERSLRDDRLLENNLSALASSINGYARNKDALPSSLSELELEGDEKLIVEKGLVVYRPNTQPATTTQSRSSTSTTNLNPLLNTRKIYFYELCATFKDDSRYGSSYNRYNDSSNDYSTYISTYSHKAGENCYKVRTDY